MTIAKNSLATKIATAIVALAAGAMMLGFATPASAQTNAELEAQIQSLLETIASLQAQVGGSGSAGMSNCPSSIFSLSAGVGATGTAVQDLQVFLNMDTDTRVSATGPGSPGNESMYFGALTADAVSAFQTKYSADVLAPLGLVSATGYWGNSSAAKAQELCADMGDDADDSDDDSDDDSGDLEGGEASLEDFDFKSGDDSDVNEGESAEVAEFEFDVENADVRISRIDISASSTGNSTETDPWDAFEEISISVDGEEIASEDVSDEDDWLENDDEPYEFRFSGLDYVVREGETFEAVITVTANDNVDDAGTSASWDIFIGNDNIRAIDAAGVNQYTGDTSDTTNFDIHTEGSDDEFDVETSSSDPDASTIEVDDDSVEGWFDIFVFELSADDGDNDIEIDSIPVTIQIADGSGFDIGDVINDLELVIDGETFDDYTLSTESGTSTIATFDIDGDYTLEAGEEVEVALGVEFKAADGTNYSSGETIQASVTSDGSEPASATDIEGEGADDIVADGSATGEVHTLLSSGLFAYEASTDTDTSGQNDTIGEFIFDFTIEAFEDDFYFEDDASGFNYTVTGATSSVSTSTAVSFGGDTAANDTYVVREGESEDVTVTVTVDPAASGLFRVQLNNMEYGTITTDTDSSTYTFSPAGDYRTKSININN